MQFFKKWRPFTKNRSRVTLDPYTAALRLAAAKSSVLIDATAYRTLVAGVTRQTTQAPGGRQVRVWGQKTVVHVLVDCPRLQALRRELRRGFKDAFNSASALLGGRGTRDQATLSAVLDFAEASGRFQAGCRVELNAGTERNLHNHASTRH